MVKVNGKEIKAEFFAYDGCHRIYLLNNPTEYKAATDMGYEIHSIDKLAEKYICSCGLRFIDNWTDLKSIVPQCSEKTKFVVGTKNINYNAKTDRVGRLLARNWAKANGLSL